MEVRRNSDGNDGKMQNRKRFNLVIIYHLAFWGKGVKHDWVVYLVELILKTVKRGNIVSVKNIISNLITNNKTKFVHIDKHFVKNSKRNNFIHNMGITSPISI